MCRIAAYLGPEAPLDRLLLSGPHDLVAQSYRPKQMRDALLNADGFGVAWYGDPGQPTPALYRTAMPLWGDENFPRMAPHLRAGCVLANVRSATPGFSVSTANVSPFVHGSWAFTHNGFLAGFRDGLARTLRSALGDAAWGVIHGHTDSEHLFALFLDLAARRDLVAGAGDPALLGETLGQTLATTADLLHRRDRSGLLSLAVTDGHHLAVARHAVAADPPTLHQRTATADGLGSGVLLASEPFEGEGDGWTAVAPGEVLVFGPEATAPIHRRPIPDAPERSLA